MPGIPASTQTEPYASPRLPQSDGHDHVGDEANVFRDREGAGRALAAELVDRRIAGDLVVLGIPRGGVPVAACVAEALGAPLGVVVARKLTAPWQPELAIGAVASDGTVYVDEWIAELAGADEAYIEKERIRQAREAQNREARFNGARIGSLAGKTAIIVDDGIATGATAIAAVRSIKARGAMLVVLAVPVGPPDTIEKLRREADEVVCLRIEPDFFAVGQFYEEFSQVDDDEVLATLEAMRSRESTHAPPEELR